MSSATDVPVNITPEATAYAAELGLQDVFERVLARALKTIPGIRSVLVKYEPGFEIAPDCVLIEPTVADYDTASEAAKAWGVWRLTEIPPQQGDYFSLLLIPELNDEG